ncbi:MAG: M43 family zinc metalloprotease [Bacteroidota bacterium]
MRKQFVLLAVLFLTNLMVGNSIAQYTNWCGTDLYMERQFENNPLLKQQFEENFRKINNNVKKHIFKKGTVHVIPLVVHVIHYNGAGNISKEQIEDGIRIMNEDYRKLNADTSNTRPVFKPYSTNCEIEYRLAKIDPNGYCTEGIVRVNSPLSNEADNSVKSTSDGGSDAWPTNKYLNVWLVNSIDDGGSSGIILGYAQYPGYNWENYGFVNRHDAWGQIGTAVYDGRTPTHEIGHCLGLPHTFDDGCGDDCSSSGDHICDTPPTSHETYGCNTAQNTCDNDTSGPSPYSSDVVDQIENYMSYDACQNMFTLEQKDRMKATLASFNQLQNLTSASNLIATGTNDGYVASPCTPIADFYADNTTICAGSSTTYTDATWNGEPISWNWLFPGGAPGSSTDSSPTVQYSTPGIYNVELSVSNGSNGTSITKTSYIHVLTSPGIPMPYSESFENLTIPGNDWVIVNSDNGNTWELTDDASYSGNYSLKMNNYIGNTSGEIDEVISPFIDLSVMESAQLTFKVAYAQKSPSTDDILKFYASKDCGNIWILKWVSDGSSLAGANGVQTTAFIPADTNDWQEFSVNIINFSTQDFSFKFEFTSDEGNNLYIDDINIDGTYQPIPILVSPPNYSTNQPVDVTIDWNAVAGINLYQYEIDSSFLFSSSALISGTNTYISSSDTDPDTEYQLTGLDFETTYYWKARTITGTDTADWSSIWRFTIVSAVGIDNYLSSNLNLTIFPNPIENFSVVSFNLNKPGQHVIIRIYDVLGREISRIVDKELNAGNHQFKISSTCESLPHDSKKGIKNPGIYLMKLDIPAEQVILTRKIIK